MSGNSQSKAANKKTKTQITKGCIKREIWNFPDDYEKHKSTYLKEIFYVKK